MKIVRFLDGSSRERYGEWVSEDTARVIEGDLFGEYSVTEETVEIAKLLAPVTPRTALCIGLNYRQHAEEGGNDIPEYPVLFIKAANTLNNPGDPIVVPTVEPETVDYECELAVVIGREAKNVSQADALDYVLGYTCANDVSGRTWQTKKGGSQWCRGKSFDTFLPLGPCLVTPDEIPDPNALKLSTTLNGEVMQEDTTGSMIFPVPELVAEISRGTTLLPGTVILTGTPSGVGMAREPKVFLNDGDTIEVEIEGIGTLTNTVQRAFTG